MRFILLFILTGFLSGQTIEKVRFSIGHGFANGIESSYPFYPSPGMANIGAGDLGGNSATYLDHLLGTTDQGHLVFRKDLGNSAVQLNVFMPSGWSNVKLSLLVSPDRTSSGQSGIAHFDTQVYCPLPINGTQGTDIYPVPVVPINIPMLINPGQYSIVDDLALNTSHCSGTTRRFICVRLARTNVSEDTYTGRVAFVEAIISYTRP